MSRPMFGHRPLWLAAGSILMLVLWVAFSILARQTVRASSATASDFGEWKFIGPKHLVPTGAPTAWTGRVTSLAVDPANQNHWLAGAAMGGVWDTRDAGVTWEPRTDG